jgi:hypothetical protein
VTLAPAPLVALVAATLLGGVAIGAAIDKQLEAIGSDGAAGAVARPAATFNAVEFRAGERAPLGVAPATTFDADQFRAGERAPLGIQPASGDSGTQHRDRLGGP